jgi:hypothetical protein
VGGAFYEPLGDGGFRSTGHTAGPWNAESQHLGPPSGLLTRALEGVPADGSFAIARVTVEILGPVPVAELEVSAGVERSGRSVELVSAELRAGDRAVARARAWRMLRSDSAAIAAGFGDPLPPPESARPSGRPEGWGSGYLDAMEWRSLRGDFDVPGAATVWARQQVDLVAGEAPSALQRLLTVADTGNGISARLDPRRWWFINTDLTVHVYREPEGEWIGLDANTVIGPHGAGTALSTLYDRTGPVAAGAQALLVRPR